MLSDPERGLPVSRQTRLPRGSHRGARQVLAVLALVGAALVGPSAAHARAPGVRIEEVMAGANGDSRLQFIELRVRFARRNRWGPVRRDRDFPASRAMLTFHDATGAQTGAFEFPGRSRPQRGRWFRRSRSVPVATEAFQQLTGLPADYVIPPEIVPVDGMVCFRDNSAPDPRSAVSHYTSTAFWFSEAALIMERVRIILSEDEIDDLVAFLEAISVDPGAD